MWTSSIKTSNQIEDVLMLTTVKVFRLELKVKAFESKSR